jgi:potassium efflux system protein
VTVNNVSGTVTKIRMRATTVTDWERKELIIPNKNFITGEVINWSLSDPTLRTTIIVGVGYGEDIDLAERALMEVAHKNSLVLADPKPYVLFNQFGDSTLNFELRVFLPSIDCLIAARHQLHMAVAKKFREYDIEIAFPQRDLNLRSTGDLGELIKQGLVARASQAAQPVPAENR